MKLIYDNGYNNGIMMVKPGPNKPIKIISHLNDDWVYSQLFFDE